MNHQMTRTQEIIAVERENFFVLVEVEAEKVVKEKNRHENVGKTKTVSKSSRCRITSRVSKEKNAIAKVARETNKKKGKKKS